MSAVAARPGLAFRDSTNLVRIPNHGKTTSSSDSSGVLLSLGGILSCAFSSHTKVGTEEVVLKSALTTPKIYEFESVLADKSEPTAEELEAVASALLSMENRANEDVDVWSHELAETLSTFVD